LMIVSGTALSPGRKHLNMLTSAVKISLRFRSAFALSELNLNYYN
jgi:hypothetical protein